MRVKLPLGIAIVATIALLGLVVSHFAPDDPRAWQTHPRNQWVSGEHWLGTMIYWALKHQAILGGRWLWVIPPIVSIMLTFIGFFLISNAIADRMRHVEARPA